MEPNACIWITGAGGLIGSHLVLSAPRYFPDAKIVALTRPRLELTDFPEVRARYLRDRPQAILHCAALSRSPDCQANPALARNLNVDVTRCLVELAEDIPFVLLSSDLVFDGNKGNYVETDPVNPLSVYAETKVAAEKIVSANPSHLIVRTSLNGGISPTGDRGFNEQLRQTWRAGKPAKLFRDEYRSPIPAEFTARAVWELLRANQTGVFHVAGAERLSRLIIGELIAFRCPELNPKIESGSLKDYAGAPRPADSSLNCARAEKVLTFPLPRLSKWLDANPRLSF